MKSLDYFIWDWVFDNDWLSSDIEGDTRKLSSRIPLLFKLEINDCVLHYYSNVYRIHFFNVDDCDSCLLYMESMTKPISFPKNEDFKITISDNKGNSEVVLYGEI